ncbi:hypothetical protein [Clostridium tertium]
MAKRVVASNWTVVIKDETGAFVNIDYNCPYCHLDSGELISIGANNLDKINSSFETDQVCCICGKDVIIECR